VDYDDEKFNTLRNDPRVLFINMKGYADWRDVVNEILSCEYIISSSLHGLIVSEAYSIPNLWIKVSDKIRGGEFKYQDYFQSIGIMNASPFCIHNGVSFEDLWKKKLDYIKGSIALEPLISAAPKLFNITNFIL
jgi:pyruvyltransferase